MSEWRRIIRLHEINGGPLRLHLAPGAEERAKAAAALSLAGLPALTADLVVRSWMDGAELMGRLAATVTQVCGVSLEPFDTDVASDFTLRLVPASSPHAPQPPEGDLALDPEADDPPDVLDGDEIDVSAYVLEQLALEIDPYPRKPDAVFSYEADEAAVSPFAVLKALRPAED